ncbi:MAG: hypothetical protein Q8R02_17130 [Hyphomonadaceae bacterium]|nr:hypothetical protein [Hyphomonadaceae bacterium]
MTSRLTTRTVTFTRPFILDEINSELPAGSYTVETEEEPLDGVSFLAYRRVSTSFIVRPGPEVTGTQMWLIHPDGLAAALERDRETAPAG